MQSFSKARLMAYRQCSKRFWLEMHHPELCEHAGNTQARFEVG
jgi:hypothetical protein